MDRSVNEINSEIWDVEVEMGVEHYLQTKEQYIKQHADKSVDELMQKLSELRKQLINSKEMVVNEIIHEHFESCKREYSIEPEPYNTLYDRWDFWFSKYVKCLPTAWRDGIINDDEICYLLEKSGDYFAGYDAEEDLKDAWMPYNALLEKVN